MTDIPEFDDIIDVYVSDDEYELISDSVTGTWRHGSEHEKVIRRKSDGAFFMATYSTTPSEGVCYERGDAGVVQVYPHTITTIEYRTEPQS